MPPFNVIKKQNLIGEVKYPRFLHEWWLRLTFPCKNQAVPSDPQHPSTGFPAGFQSFFLLADAHLIRGFI
jgi:hypothetical protein